MEINGTYSYTVLFLNSLTVIHIYACINLGTRRMKWLEHAARMGKRRISCRRFENFSADHVNVTILVYETSCSLVDSYHGMGETYLLYHKAADSLEKRL
jgi:hypothetical protein